MSSPSLDPAIPEAVGSSPSAEPSPGPSPWALRLSLGVPLLGQTLSMLWLVLSRRQVLGHDALQYFTIQHYFFEQRAVAGVVAWWMPYLTHGTVSNWWLYIQASPLATCLLWTGWIPAGADPLLLFQLGLWFMQVLFLTGTWLFLERYAPHPAARFLVLASCAGTTLWVDQIWYNLHQFWALPLVFHLTHRFLETGRARWAFLAVHLLGVQGLGNMPYALPFQSFVAAAYAGLAAATFPDLRAGLWRKLLGWRPVSAVVAAGALSLAPGYVLMKHGTEEIFNQNVYREPDGSVTLETFLTYGGNTDFGKWLDTVTGLSPRLDVKLSFGICLVPFALYGLLAGGRRAVPLAAMTALLVLLSAGLFPAHALYYGWPMMKFFRHLGLTAPIARIFVVPLAGLGLQRLFEPDGRRVARALVAAGTTLLLLGWIHGSDGDFKTYLQAARDNPRCPTPDELSSGTTAADLLLRTRTAATCGLVAAAGLVLVASGGRRRWVRFAVAGLLLTHVVDVVQFHVLHVAARTTPLSPEAVAAQRFTPMPFVPRRSLWPLDADADAAPSPSRSFESDNIVRTRERLAGSDRGRCVPNLRFVYCMHYWSVFQFLRYDEYGTSARVDHWLASYNDLLDSLFDGPQGTAAKRYSSLSWSLAVPDRDPWMPVVAGVTEDKLQFFSEAELLRDRLAVRERLLALGFAGNQLLVYDPPHAGGDVLPSVPRDLPFASAPRRPDESTRLRPDYEVTRFDANTLEFRVENDSGAPAWALYCDCWHPFWKAEVNGEPVPVLVAQLAYKAVPLVPGTNTVHLRCDPDRLPTALAVAGLNAALWCALGTLLAARALAVRRDDEPRRIVQRS